MTRSNTARYAAAIFTLGAIVALPFAVPANAQGAAPEGCYTRSGEETGVWINVVTEGVKSSDGLYAVTIYEDNRRKFLAKKGSLTVARFPAQAGTSHGCVFLPKTGVYAIAVYHDENGNRKFDRGLLPEEGFGFSNNPSTLAGLPSFRSVRINVSKTNLTARINMRYP